MPPTPEPTNTDQPTATPAPTNTPTPTTTPLPTKTNTPTLLPTIDLTQIAEQVFATQTAFAENQTLNAPTPTSTVTITPLPTLDVTPTFITAEALTPLPTAEENDEDLGIVLPGQQTPEPAPITNTPTPAPTVDISVPIPATVSIFDLPTLAPVESGPPASIPFAITTNGIGGFDLGGFSLDTGGVLLFARNPVDPSQYVLTNGAGTLYTVDGGGRFRPSSSPFSEFEPGTPEENNAYVEFVTWSPNGQFVAYIIDAQRHPNPDARDGVWILDVNSGGSRQLLRDAPTENHPGYQLGNVRDFLHVSEYLEWSPQSDVVLAQVRRADPGSEDQQFLFVLGLDEDPNRIPGALRYDYGSWTNDGNRLVVSGRNPQGRIIIGTVNRDGSDEQVLLDGRQIGQWLRNAVQRPNGQIVALARPFDIGGMAGPVRIIDQNGTPLTDFIGTDTPTSVNWSPDKSAVIVTTGGRTYIATVTGTIRDITDSLSDTQTVNWVSGGLPSGSTAPAEQPVDQNFVPSGVVEGTRFQPGQQLTVLVDELNIRSEPNTNNNPIGVVQNGEFVAILAGPVDFDNIEWWRVQVANGTVGWIAAVINGNITLG